MAIKVVSTKTEKVLEKNSNIYLERAEEKLKIGQYGEALEDARLAVKYSNNKTQVVEQYNRIKSTVDEYYFRLKSDRCIKVLENQIKLAKKGMPKAQCDLAEMYYWGKNVEQNYEEAFKWYKKSSVQGYAEAQCKLGDMYYEGQGIDKDIKETLKWYEKSAEQGYAEAQMSLGAYYMGKGLKQDYKESFKWLEKSSEQGNAKAQYLLGCQYYLGRGVAKDMNKGLSLIKCSAHQGTKAAIDILKTIDNPKPSGGCFLTTAMCETLEKKDNCYELEELRNFRDNVLLKTKNGQELVSEYYDIAPKIAEKLKSNIRKLEIAQKMNKDYIIPIIEHIHKGHNDTAIIKYKDMVCYVRNRVESN